MFEQTRISKTTFVISQLFVFSQQTHRCDTQCLLSNDPGKVDTISFVMRQRCFPHIEIFSFLHRECIILHEGSLRNKMHLHSTLKGCFFVLKDFDQSQELKTTANKSLQFYMFPTQDFFVIQSETRFCYMEDGWKVRMNVCTAL